MRSLTKSKTWFKLSFAAGMALFVLSVAGLAVNAPKTYAMCDAANVIHCGLSGSTTQAYINSVKNYWTTSKDDAGHTDIRAVMQWGGWSSSIVNGATTANTKVGTLTSSTGKITVDGRVVATGTLITARFTHGAGFKQISPGVWARLSTTEAAQSSYKVLIHFGANGKADAGIIVDCGNVLQFTPTPPPAAVAQCTSLTAAILDKANLQYGFTANAKVTNAALTGGSFDFGDGSKGTGTVKGTTVIANHKYAKAGTYTAVATLTFTAYDQKPTATCKTTITVTVPFYSCVNLGGSILDKDKYSYRFVATMQYGNGAEFSDATFDFGDGQTASGVKSTDGKTVTVDHTYKQAGEYHAFATLRFNVNGSTVTAPACKAFVTPTAPPTPECKPGIPVGDVRCNPCEYDASITADDTRCVAPATTLPNTGAGNAVAVAAAALVAGFLWYRHILFRRHKRAYMAADLGVSPLPLAEPLESDKPLEGTPLAEQGHKSTLRRRRPF